MSVCVILSGSVLTLQYVCVLREAETQTYLISFMTSFKSYVNTANTLTTSSVGDEHFFYLCMLRNTSCGDNLIHCLCNNFTLFTRLSFPLNINTWIFS